MAAALITHIHHERQEPGSMLCAQHALNALLQGSFYDPSQLSDIAKRLDDLEKTQLNDEAWENRDRQSLNMDDTGYFSVSVLEQALEVWGLSLVRWRSEVMRPYQSKPEEQLAFVLNLDSHWFTIRGFLNGYWFNLNSFLPQPSWVGPSYLGALLDAAETEGYSVFVVKSEADSRNTLQSSPADDCAATLPPASVAGGAGASSAADSGNLGLRPNATEQSSSFNASSRGPAEADEDADLQAALRASMADADLGSNSGTSSTGVRSPALPSPTRSHIRSAAGQRRSRRANSGEEDDREDEEETDAHVDAIAPSRQRARASNLLIPGSPYVLPTASGGRRRASRQHALEEDENFGGGIWEASTGTGLTSSRRRGNRGQSGNNIESAISLDDENIDRDMEDEEEIQAVSSAPRSPFLNSILAQASGSGTASDDEFHSVSSGQDVEEVDGWEGLGESMTRPRHQGDRTYDDEDAELQAALAASMREAEARGIGEERASIMEAQLREWARGDSSSPPPADVEKIQRMRAEARRKEREERDRAAQGEPEKFEAPEAEVKDEESSEEEAPMSPDAMRKARLARFGG